MEMNFIIIIVLKSAGVVVEEKAHTNHFLLPINQQRFNIVDFGTFHYNQSMNAWKQAPMIK